MDSRLLIALCVISGLVLGAWALNKWIFREDDDEPPSDMGWGV